MTKEVEIIHVGSRLLYPAKPPGTR
ncbi:hypothetical protein PMIN01_09813 [Paraphaeosphaeria minitans]|uniref:Uncharacterized protein n=1 Tax=Paraphaeosphaeria minitans TaxID=565426 RepID=A0A9P6GCU1_9PLEO|nr:hypothetical protein PMIN01_09813 [Paraphaeosphaeria minitans]